MYDLPQNNIDFLKSNPIYYKYNFSNLSAINLIKEINNYKQKNKISVPETDAFIFYLANHAIHVITNKYKDEYFIPQDILDFAKKCNDYSTRISKALFFHVCLVGNGMLWVNKFDSNQESFFSTNYSQDFVNFISSHNRKNDFQGINKFPNLTINNLLGGISSVFSFRKIVNWGQPYSNIVKVVHKTSRGIYSLHTAGDQIWSLCHNGGTVLNKGIGGIYNVATNYIFDILDVQDAGQIPQYIDYIYNNKNNVNKKYLSKELIDIYLIFKKHFPNEFTKLDNNKIKISNEKRIKAHELMNKQYKAWWNMNFNNNNVNTYIQKEIIPEQKINNILIDDFKKNKWI